MTYQPGPTRETTWTVHDDHVSLVRAPIAPTPLRVSAEPQAIEIDLARTALVVVDMQNDFCHTAGWFGCKGIGVAPMRKPINAIAGLSEAATESRKNSSTYNVRHLPRWCSTLPPTACCTVQ